jgi:hypothetical protein
LRPVDIGKIGAQEAKKAASMQFFLKNIEKRL